MGAQQTNRQLDALLVARVLMVAIGGIEPPEANASVPVVTSPGNAFAGPEGTPVVAGSKPLPKQDRLENEGDNDD